MKLLLDTCTFLWLAADPQKLPEKVRSALTTTSEEVFLSSISVWELVLKSRKHSLLRLRQSPMDLVEEQIHVLGLEELPLTIHCMTYLSRLPMYHQDPFDRMLICQALEEGCMMITPDENIHRYPVPVLW